MQEGTVRVSKLNLRESPKTGAVVKELRKNSRVTVLGSETWHRVRTPDGKEGYVFGDFVELERTPDVAPAHGGAPSDTLQLMEYRKDRFIGAVAQVDADFVPHLDRVAGFAEACKLKVFVTSSTRDPKGGVSNAVVKPATRSNHFVGHAIDFNLQLDSGAFFNSAKLAKLSEQPKKIRDFIKMIRDDPDLRWGGDFSTPDVVHFDDKFNLEHPTLWDSKFASRG